MYRIRVCMMQLLPVYLHLHKKYTYKRLPSAKISMVNTGNEKALCLFNAVQARIKSAWWLYDDIAFN